MDLKFLDFEQPIAELEAKIEELRFVGDDSEININEEVARLRDKSETLTKSIFSKLSAWQIAQVARHPMRIFRNCTAIACMPMIRPSSVV
jgi:acetyl-CoA carboxylase carboxyl transferase subunit alpha